MTVSELVLPSQEWFCLARNGSAFHRVYKNVDVGEFLTSSRLWGDGEHLAVENRPIGTGIKGVSLTL